MKYRPKPTWWEILLVAFVILMIALAYNQLVYDDWTCTFAKCVKHK